METNRSEEPDLTRKARNGAGRMVMLIAGPAVFLCGMLYAYLFNPTKTPSVFAKCYFHEFTGLYCPGCGDTRSLHALLHLQFLDAFNHNLMFPFALAGLLYLLLGEYLKLLVGHRVFWLPRKVPIPVVVILVAAVLLFFVLRNLPFFPFSWLAPGL